MAYKNTFQYKETISINRNSFRNKIVRNDELTKKDLRVFMHLLTHLDASNPKKISKKRIAEELNMSKKDVESAIDDLMLYEIIAISESSSVENGYVILF